MERRNDCKFFSARLALLNLAICALNDAPVVEGFAPLNPSVLNVKNKFLPKQDVLRTFGSFEDFSQPEPLFQDWALNPLNKVEKEETEMEVEEDDDSDSIPEEVQSTYTDNNNKVENQESEVVVAEETDLTSEVLPTPTDNSDEVGETEVAVEDNTMPEAQLISIDNKDEDEESEVAVETDITLEVQSTSTDDDDLPSLEAQQEEIISLPEQAVETEAEAKADDTKDQSQTSEVGAVKQRSVNEIKLRYDFAARRTNNAVSADTTQSKADEAKEIDDDDDNDDVSESPSVVSALEA